MIKLLEYYFADGSNVIFGKYTIDTTGIVRNSKTGKVVKTRKKGPYNGCTVYNNDKNPRDIQISRALASTFEGRPPTLEHTADHIDRNPNNDTLENIRWSCKKGQRGNQDRPKTHKTAFIIVKDGLEKTTNEWVDYFRDEKTHYGRDYTVGMVKKYAQNNKYGFSYKVYPDIQGEVWMEIAGSNNANGYWKISNMNRVKYVTKYAENVLSGERLSLRNGYPRIKINGESLNCHNISFMTFFPEEWANKRYNEVIMHEDDDKTDFRPHKLRLGTRADNNISAYDNGCYDGKQTARMKCTSYINGILEKEHDSQAAAARYLNSRGYETANYKRISEVLKAYKNGEILTRYGRTWQTI
jgi:hypothetical protein